MRMPNGLGYQGQKLWKAVTGEYNICNAPHKQRILQDACETADLIDEMKKGQRGEPLTVKGSQQQPVIHPLISELRFARALLAQLLARLNFEEDGDDE